MQQENHFSGTPRQRSNLKLKRCTSLKSVVDAQPNWQLYIRFDQMEGRRDGGDRPHPFTPYLSLLSFYADPSSGRFISFLLVAKRRIGEGAPRPFSSSGDLCQKLPPPCRKKWVTGGGADGERLTGRQTGERERGANGWELAQKGSNEINISLPPLLLPHRALRPIAILHSPFRFRVQTG